VATKLRDFHENIASRFCFSHHIPHNHTHHNRFTALFLVLPGWAGARRETSGLYGARED